MRRMKRIWHPGIETEYVFDSWEDARRELEARHGGLAEGMLASCIEVELTDIGEKLDAAGVECQGREWSHTLTQTVQSGAKTLQLADMTKEGRDELRRVLRLSPNRWAKWYYTDAVGNASLLCWQRYEE
jgi:hypothetical protein